MLPEAVRSGAVPFALAHGGLDMHQVSALFIHKDTIEEFQSACGGWFAVLVLLWIDASRCQLGLAFR